MNTQPTPRTDDNDLGWRFHEQHGDFDSLSDNPLPWLDFAKMLELELTAVTEQRDRLAEACQDVVDSGGHFGDLVSAANNCQRTLQSLTPKP